MDKIDTFTELGNAESWLTDASNLLQIISWGFETCGDASSSQERLACDAIHLLFYVSALNSAHEKVRNALKAINSLLDEEVPA